MLAVREHARGHHLGERLKHYQRDILRALGVETMYWTFDPLVARNAHFNLNRLGATIAEYMPNFYGSKTGSILHGALPTDRFVAQWAITPPADEGVRGAAPPRTAAAVRTASVHDGHVRVIEAFPTIRACSFRFRRTSSQYSGTIPPRRSSGASPRVRQ